MMRKSGLLGQSKSQWSHARTFFSVFGAGVSIVLLSWIVFNYWDNPKVPSNKLLEQQSTFQASHGSARLFILGDIGTGDEFQKKVAETMEFECRKNRGIDGIILLGDNFYQHGVKSIDDPQWKSIIEEPYGSPCLSKTTIFPILGHHDYQGNIKAQIDRSTKDPRWHMPHNFYHVEVPNLLQLIATDTNRLEYCFDPSRCSMDHLLSRLDKRDQYNWSIVMGHHPISHSSKRHNELFSIGKNFRSQVLRWLLCRRADVYLAGHTHHLEFRQEKGCDTNLFVSGAGGGKLYPLESYRPNTIFAADQHGFLDLVVAPSELKYRFINIDGNEINSGTIKKTRKDQWLTFNTKTPSPKDAP